MLQGRTPRFCPIDGWHCDKLFSSLSLREYLHRIISSFYWKYIDLLRNITLMKVYWLKTLNDLKRISGTLWSVFNIKQSEKKLW